MKVQGICYTTNLPGYHWSPDIESNCVGFSELCNQSQPPLWGAFIWFIAIDAVAGVAWIIMCFISFWMALIDSTTQQCSSCPALNNNSGTFDHFLAAFPLVHDRYCMQQACVKLHLCMHLGVHFPVHAVHTSWEHKLNIVMALGVAGLLCASPTAIGLEVKNRITQLK